MNSVSTNNFDEGLTGRGADRRESLNRLHKTYYSEDPAGKPRPVRLADSLRKPSGVSGRQWKKQLKQERREAKELRES